MPDLDHVAKQIIEAGIDLSTLPKGDVRELPNILWDDEKISDIVRGTYKSGNGVLVATNKRLIFVNRGFIYGINVEDFPYDKINSIQYSTGILLGEIAIYVSGNAAEIRNVSNDECRRFSEHVRAMITDIQKDHSVNAQKMELMTDNEDFLVKLERLSKLKQSGMITEAEFVAAKAKLLRL